MVENVNNLPRFRGLKEYMNKKLRVAFSLHEVTWRYRPDLNWGMKVLQTFALPLGHGTI